MCVRERERERKRVSERESFEDTHTHTARDRTKTHNPLDLLAVDDHYALATGRAVHKLDCVLAIRGLNLPLDFASRLDHAASVFAAAAHGF